MPSWFMRARWVGCVGLLMATSASAFTLETRASEGCHERITTEAIRRAGWGLAPPAITAADQRLADNLLIHLPHGWDPWLMAALIGDRDNDLHGGAITDLVKAPWEDYAAHDQRAHCLRAQEDTKAEGDLRAVSECQAFISNELATARAASAQDTEQVSVALRFEIARVTLAKRAFHLGKAMHAIQDSFAHTYRDEDFHGILTVFNYATPALGGEYAEGTNGHAHQSLLDSCDGPSAFQSQRVEAAIQASVELLKMAQEEGNGVVLAEGETPTAEQAFFASWLTVRPGCTVENGWCGGKARYAEVENAAGCAAAPGDASVWAVLLGGMAWTLRRRRGA